MNQVALHIPNETLEFSEAALDHLRGRLKDSGALALQLGLVESGCSGYMYEMDYINDAAVVSQHVRVSQEVPIFVSRAQLPLVLGTRVDYVTEGLNAMLRFENPKASGSCGCGESFSISPQENESPSSNAG